MSVRILEGDCRDVLRTLSAESFDSVVTDPPYGINFMGKAWDRQHIVERAAQRAGNAQPPHRDGSKRSAPRRALAEEAGAYDLFPNGMRAFQEWTAEWAEQAFRVLKPGGWLLCFASTRTYHRMACGLEDAGFEIRDQIGWLFGSGFPKNRDFAKDHAASKLAGSRIVRAAFLGHPQSVGWGTALKPGWEPIAVARKPFKGSVDQNVLKYGTGALNIDCCRIAAESMRPNTGKGALPRRYEGDIREGSPCGQPHDLGRWPANVVHDGSDEVLAAFPDAPGQLADASTSNESRKTQTVYGAMQRGNGRDGEASANAENVGAVGFQMRPGARRSDVGSAARFFYCAKASKADREAGSEPGERANHHPTVKPTSLMRWLCRLVTPPGGLILDPFAGSGSTGRAADIEGFSAILIEEDAEYAAIARRRVNGDAPLFAEIA